MRQFVCPSFKGGCSNEMPKLWNGERSRGEILRSLRLCIFDMGTGPYAHQSPFTGPATVSSEPGAGPTLPAVAEQYSQEDEQGHDRGHNRGHHNRRPASCIYVSLSALNDQIIPTIWLAYFQHNQQTKSRGNHYPVSRLGPMQGLDSK